MHRSDVQVHKFKMFKNYAGITFSTNTNLTFYIICDIMFSDSQYLYVERHIMALFKKSIYIPKVCEEIDVDFQRF